MNQVQKEQHFVGKLQMSSDLFANVRNLQFDYARELKEKLFIPVLMYGWETVLYREDERLRIKAVHIDNLKSLLCIWRNRLNLENTGLSWEA